MKGEKMAKGINLSSDLFLGGGDGAIGSRQVSLDISVGQVSVIANPIAPTENELSKMAALLEKLAVWVVVRWQLRS